MTVPLALGPAWLNPQNLLQDVGTSTALWVAALVIFAECGLLLGFFLPGDSLLFTVGLLTTHGATIDGVPFQLGQPIWLACVVLTVAAFVGNVVGYEIGRASGPAIFNRGNSRIFRREYVDKTFDFFDRHGPKAIVLARFVPIVRTFITVTAGVGRMDRRTYLTFSAVGAMLWACGVTILGRLLGKVDFIKNHIEVALLLVVLVSVLPAVVEWLRHRAASRRAGDVPDGVGEPLAAQAKVEETVIEAKARHAVED